MITLLLLLSEAALAQEVTTAPLPDEAPASSSPEPAAESLQIESWSLGDQTEVLLVSDHRVPLVQVNLVFPVGLWSPWMRDQNGEEAWEIQLDDPEGEFDRRADALATKIFATVTAESSILTITCLKEDLPEALTLVEDVLSGRDFMKDELKRWNKQQSIDWEGNLKDTGFQLDRAAMSVLFEESDPRYSAWLKPEAISQDVSALAETRDQILKLPGRIIGFSGDLTREEAERIAPTLLPVSEAPPSGVDYELKSIKTERPEEVDVTLPKLTQVYLSYTAPGPSWSDPNYAAFLIAQHVLGGHFHSRLYMALRHEDGDTYGVRASSRIFAEPGSIEIKTFSRLDNAETIETKLRQTVQTFHADGISEQELKDAVSHLEGRMRSKRQSPGQVLNQHIWEVSSGQGLGHEAGLLEAYSSLTLEEVNAAIDAIYHPDGFTMVRVIPES